MVSLPHVVSLSSLGKFLKAKMVVRNQLFTVQINTSLAVDICHNPYLEVWDMFNNLSSSGGEKEILTKYFLFCDIVPLKTPQILSTFPAVILTPLQKNFAFYQTRLWRLDVSITWKLMPAFITKYNQNKQPAQDSMEMGCAFTNSFSSVKHLFANQKNFVSISLSVCPLW